MAENHNGDLISRQAFTADLRESYEKLMEIYKNLPPNEDISKQMCSAELCTFAEVLMRLKDFPPTEAEVVRHGRWEPVKYNVHCSCGKSYGTLHYNCSVCNHVAYAQPYGLKYCPNCGCKMDGGGEDV